MKQNQRQFPSILFSFLLFFLLFGSGKKAQQLDCPEFDVTCQWLNLNVASASNSTLTWLWYRSSTIIDPNQLLMTTGTNAAPNGSYAIASTINIDMPNATQSATLISALIPCQNNNATLNFNYWTSPFVILNICCRSEGVMLNRSTDCQRAPYSQGPGPASIPISSTKSPFRLSIDATNFIYSNGQLTGGFAILDNLKYTGDFCKVVTTPAPSANGTMSANSTISSNSTLPSPASNSTMNPSMLASNVTNANSTASGNSTIMTMGTNSTSTNGTSGR